ncbi:activating transcription factor 7-interacting protein 1-like isoform X2 [Physella acuta]|uniref:activating transcription factor 7-interacting protein 1-like isoform X2 n=1 Tax=Physella acuta TaxID=109671 RepID=UPI0027DD575D|nr:activating transcription factor 7-interacting protein 1-like isoform X2 [Physella acuta]
MADLLSVDCGGNSITQNMKEINHLNVESTKNKCDFFISNSEGCSEASVVSTDTESVVNGKTSPSLSPESNNHIKLTEERNNSSTVVGPISPVICKDSPPNIAKESKEDESLEKVSKHGSSSELLVNSNPIDENSGVGEESGVEILLPIENDLDDSLNSTSNLNGAESSPIQIVPNSDHATNKTVHESPVDNKTILDKDTVLDDKTVTDSEQCSSLEEKNSFSMTMTELDSPKPVTNTENIQAVSGSAAELAQGNDELPNVTNQEISIQVANGLGDKQAQIPVPDSSFVKSTDYNDVTSSESEEILIINEDVDCNKSDEAEDSERDKLDARETDIDNKNSQESMDIQIHSESDMTAESPELDIVIVGCVSKDDSKADDLSANSQNSFTEITPNNPCSDDPELIITEENLAVKEGNQNISLDTFSFKNILQQSFTNKPTEATEGSSHEEMETENNDLCEKSSTNAEGIVDIQLDNKESTQSELKPESIRKRALSEDGSSSFTKKAKSEDQLSSENKNITAEAKETKYLESPIQLSCEALQTFITARVKAFIRNQKQVHIEKLNKRTRNMQTASNLWKETAKHLERSVMELSLLNQKLEKRKAHSHTVKQLASRTIGIQVNEDKVKTVTSTVNTQGNTNTLRMPNRNSAPPHPQGIQTSPRFGRPNQQFSPRAPANISPRQQSSSLNKSVQQAIRGSLTSPATNNVVNLIDLTDDDDVSRKALRAPAQSNTQTTNIGAGNKTYPATNGLIHNVPMSTGTPVMLNTNNQLLAQPLNNPQFITSNNGLPGAPFQLLPINTNTTVNRPPVLALLPGARSSGPINSSIPNAQLTSPRGMLYNNSSAAAPTKTHSLPPSCHISSKHPAPLPTNQDAGNAPPNAKNRPPKPGLKISRVSQGIVLSWNMPSLVEVEKISSYQLFAYQETESSVPKSNLWKKVGDVKALPLPMACTLTQFQEGNKYHFAVRAVDQYGRCGSYSDPSSIFLGPKT